MINDWNDQYSPRKTPSSRRYFGTDMNDEELSPSESPKKSPIKSPKKDKKAVEQKKLFDSQKHDLAASFLKELDDAVTDGKLFSLSDSTGGIRVVWNKKLNSTAGRANWKREATRKFNQGDNSFTTKYRHHAFIELAEKVIDDEGKSLSSSPSSTPPITTLTIRQTVS